MTALVKVGAFTLNTATGNQSITGVGFQPTLVIFWGQQLAVVGGGNQLRRGFGCATSSSAQWAECWSFSDSPNNHDQQFVSTKCIKWNAASTDTEVVGASFVSMDVGGFTINVVTGNSVTINYMALGGSISAAVGHFNSSTTNGATQSVTGLAFQPKFAFLSRGPAVTTEAAAGECHFAYGMGSSSTSRAVTGMYMQGNSPPPVQSFQRTDELFAMIDTSTFNQTADLSSFDSGGFTIAWSLAYATSVEMGYIALGGTAQFAVFNFAAPLTGGPQSVTGIGFQPLSVMFFTNGFPASNTTLQNGIYTSIGGNDGTTSAGISAYAPSNANSTAVPYVDSSTQMSILAPNGSGGRAFAAYVTSLDGDGFSLQWDNVTGSATQVIGFAVSGLQLNVLVTGVKGTGKVGAVTVTGKANVSPTGVAGTSALGSPTYAVQYGQTVSGVQGTAQLGTTTSDGVNNFSLVSPDQMTATLGTFKSDFFTYAYAANFGLTLGVPGTVHVEVPLFGVLPNFIPDHQNTAADPSQPTRWTNVLPP